MLKRSITGFILGVLMISALVYHESSAVALLLIILAGATIEWYKHFVKKHNLIIKSIFFIFSGLVLLLIILLHLNVMAADLFFKDQLTWITLALLIFLAIGAVYSRTIIESTVNWPCWLVYILFPLLISSLFLHQDFGNHKWILLGLIIMNWSNDVFAYFTGRLLGKHPLAPHISPNKTIEGSIGGAIATMLSGLIVNSWLFTNPFPTFQIILLGLFVSVAGTTGDLYESRLKRLAGIKDSGRILPGHGGFLDRFDSFFYVVVVGIFVLSFNSN